MNHLAALARFIAETRASDIPQAAIRHATLALINRVGVSIAGSVEPVFDRNMLISCFLNSILLSTTIASLTSCRVSCALISQTR